MKRGQKKTNKNKDTKSKFAANENVAVQGVDAVGVASQGGES